MSRRSHARILPPDGQDLVEEKISVQIWAFVNGSTMFSIYLSEAKDPGSCENVFHNKITGWLFSQLLFKCSSVLMWSGKEMIDTTWKWYFRLFLSFLCHLELAVGMGTGPGTGHIGSCTMHLHGDKERCQNGLVSVFVPSWSLSWCSVKTST